MDESNYSTTVSMDNSKELKKLEVWANKLLDLGKRNNLINFKDSKTSTVEIMLPEPDDLFSMVDNPIILETYKEDDTNEYDANGNLVEKKLEFKTKYEFKNHYNGKLKKNQVLLYNIGNHPINAIKQLDKKVKQAEEESGIGIAYIAFGFVEWTEDEHSQFTYKAPILLKQVRFSRDNPLEPYKIHVSDDDFVINPTFQYKLREEKGIDFPQYNDESLQDYLHTIGVLLKPLKWKVYNEVKIGTFSFQKINMYMDLKENAEQIVLNDNVRTLMGSTPITKESDNISSSINETKVEKPLIDLHNVVDADSSQIDAIQMAKSGRNFVLQGPPGTGKSQTITNIIAEMLADNKKILFVSEKQAALNVVYNNLQKVNLEEFCLEIHSNKANKKVVIDELCETLKKNKTQVGDGAYVKIEQKQEVLDKLTGYEDELHRKNPVIGKSLYQLCGNWAECRKSEDIVCSIEQFDSLTEEDMLKQVSLLEQYKEYSNILGYNYKNTVWYGFNPEVNNIEENKKLQKALYGYVKELEEITEIVDELNENYGIECPNLVSLKSIAKFLDLSSKTKTIIPASLNGDALDKIISNVNSMNSLSNTIFSIQREVGLTFDLNALKNENAEKYQDTLTNQFSGFFSRLFNDEYKKIINELSSYKINKKKIKYKEAINLCENIKNAQKQLQEFTDKGSEIKEIIGNSYQGLNSNFAEMETELAEYKAANSHIKTYGKLTSMSNDEFYDEKRRFGRLSDRIYDWVDRQSANIREIEKHFIAEEFDINTAEFIYANDKLEQCVDMIDQIDNYCLFYTLLKKIRANKLSHYLDAFLETKDSIDNVGLGYKKVYYRQWIEKIISSSNYINEMPRIIHDKAVASFEEIDKTHFGINKSLIKEKLSSNRPSLDFISPKSPANILLREGAKKRKQMPIRKLMSEIGDFIQTIKPCFLMSPLSISTYIDPEKVEFDVVIFDEASQIFPQDAIGAIYRAQQIVVVGDSKQMPPSNFFNASIENEDDDDDYLEDIDDFESILDICSTTFNQLSLKWHYRSKFEQLIAFSNYSFYNGDLVTFPSSKTDREDIGVDYYYVDGRFINRTNKIEAEKIVEMVYDHIEKYPKRSLGVVAFSIAQQSLIENLIEKRRTERPNKLVEEFFANEKEPFFVKNLETVQGDERDTIIFSIAYGKDESGYVKQRFGPLNNAGGERRLNVAVTRAKINVKLVSSMHYTDIDLTKTKARGAELLRKYLEYAENGEIALQREIKVSAERQFDSEFEKDVYDFITSKGYEVDTQVGCSSFRIDLGLKRPGTSDYVLAIECDGAAYHSSKNARDRDRLRQQILENMGWKFYRIWSTDWFRNNSAEKKRLLEAIESATSTSSSAKSVKTNEVTEQDNYESEYQTSDVIFDIFQPYDIVKEARKKRVFFTLERDGLEYLYRREKSDFEQLIIEMVQQEGPVNFEWFMKRSCSLFDREKVTILVRRVVKELFSYDFKNTLVIRNGFIYLKKKDIEYTYKIASNKSNHDERPIECISPEELAAGIYKLLQVHKSVEKEALFNKLIAMQGNHRVNEGTRENLEIAMKLLSSLIREEGNMLKIN